MALQHLYSRVPAKMSLFNKTDGYDTFAHSEGLSFEMIEKELSDIYDNKPTKNDAILIQNGTLPPLYCQFTANDGSLVQGCMSFMPLDYTGERSAYLVHSLVMTDEERKALIESPDNAPLNPEMFRTDISGFNMTSFDSHPDSAFPEIDYKPLRAKATDSLLKQYDLGMLKRLIYALLGAASGKFKTVYLSLPFSFETFSEQSLALLNTVMQIIPYHMRPSLSFVTYVSDQTKFNSFRIKCQAENAAPVPLQKGVTLRFGTRDAIGIGDDMIARSAALVDFFYGLLSNDALRREFLIFCDRAVTAMPTLAKQSLQNIDDLVFLFRQCSGYFNEMSVLPDDNAVYEFVSTYEKYRSAISDDYRAEALKCLWRYPNTHTAIPKNVFSKISKIYPTETVASRRTVMSVVLELIHTDVMRDKLFTFISNNYEREDPDVRKAAMQDLSRVYYGGFLQTQLADFFISYYDNEPEEIRDLIVEKFLLTIRTEQIQPRVLSFFDSHYDALSAEQKRRFYTTFFEMLPEGDALAEKLIRIVDTHIPNEDNTAREEFVTRLSAAMQSDMKRKQPRLLPVLCKTNGFCRDTVVSHILTDWSGRKIFTEYVEQLRALPLVDRAGALIDVFRTAPAISDEICGTLETELLPSFTADAKRTDIYLLLSVEENLAAYAAAPAAKNTGKLCENITADAIRPAIIALVPTAFVYKRRPDGLTVLRDYAEKNAYLAGDPAYENVRTYFAITDAVLAADAAAIFVGCEKLSDKTVRTGAADHLQAEYMTGNKLADEKYDTTRFLLAVMIPYLKTDMPSASVPYQTFVEDVRAHLPSVPGGKPNPELDRQRAEEKAIAELLSLGGAAYASATSDTFRTLVFGEEAETAQILRAFVRKYDKKAKKYLAAAIPASAAHGTGYDKVAEKIVGSTSSSSSGGFLAKLFGKK